MLLESVELRQAPFILWIDNLSVRDPYFILPLLNAVFMFATQRLTPMVGMDPLQQKMMTMMPVVFSIMFAFFPGGAGALLGDQRRPVTGAAVLHHPENRCCRLTASGFFEHEGQALTLFVQSLRPRGQGAWESCGYLARMFLEFPKQCLVRCRAPGTRRWLILPMPMERSDRLRVSLLYFPAPHSFTGEHVLELQGHGGAFILQRVMQRVLEPGRKGRAPGEFSERAFLNDKLDLVQAEAIADLIDSGSDAAARAAQRSLQGVFSSRVREVAGRTHRDARICRSGH